MPRTPLHTLIWSQDHAWYKLFSFSQMQPVSILLPKLRPPRLPSLCISRGRLLARMEESRQGKLTFVLAPAGFGKTTLVRQWIETQGQNTMSSWLSIEGKENVTNHVNGFCRNNV